MTTLKEQLVDAKLDTWTACFSDDPSAQKRDDARWNSLFASQTEYTDQEISAICSDLWSGKITRQEVFGTN